MVGNQRVCIGLAASEAEKVRVVLGITAVDAQDATEGGVNVMRACASRCVDPVVDRAQVFWPLMLGSFVVYWAAAMMNWNGTT